MSSENSALLPSDEETRLGPGAGRVMLGLLVVGLVLVGASAGWGAAIGDSFRRFFFSYLTSFAYFLSFAVGALFFVIIQHLVRAEWSVTVRRTAEILSQAFPMLFLMSLVLLIPMLAGNDSLYLWSNDYVAHNDHLVHHKIGYLNPKFFAIRLVLYFAVWTLLARYFFRKSVAQDDSGDAKLSERMRIVSAPAIILYAFATAFTGFDLLMSLEPQWFSTMFGVYFFAGSAVAIFALLSIIPMLLQHLGKVKRSITVEHYHDVGKLLFAFVFFWAYIAFSQFMLIWAANIPEETGYFWHRWFVPEGMEVAWYSQWKTVSVALILGHWMFPFVVLMSRHTKRRLQALAFFAVWMLVWHWIDIFWQVMPAYNPRTVAFHPMDVMLFLGLGCLFFASVVFTMRKVNLVPTRDPKLGASLKFENI